MRERHGRCILSDDGVHAGSGVERQRSVCLAPPVMLSAASVRLADLWLCVAGLRGQGRGRGECLPFVRGRRRREGAGRIGQRGGEREAQERRE
jgi:hypothetical protein